MLAALSTAAWGALAVIGGAAVTAAGAVLVARVSRERTDQDKETTQSIGDYNRAYHERGDIITGYQTDHAALIEMISELRRDHEALIADLRRDHATRIELVEEREQNCLDALELAQHRIAVLEERDPGRHG